MDDYLNKNYDRDLAQLVTNTQADTQLKWLPWVGRNYTEQSDVRLLVVAESHYYSESLKAHHGRADFTRKVVYECPIAAQWPNRTLGNITRLLPDSEPQEEGAPWTSIAFYNFIQRPMDYLRKERPTWPEFYHCWEVFFNLVRVLEPTHCVFIGVSASRTFDAAAEHAEVSHSKVEWHERIGNAYGRTCAADCGFGELPIAFVQHAGTHFSWPRWRAFLQEKLPGAFGSVDHSQDSVADDSDDPPLEGLPTHLQHKPIVASFYPDVEGNEASDARFLSIGRAQYSNDSASVKLFRRSKDGTRWSRQSEELPLARACDMALLVATVIRRLQSNEGCNDHESKSTLNEKVVAEEDLDFLRQALGTDRVSTSLRSLREVLNSIDLENCCRRAPQTAPLKSTPK
jgi:hypothetical protein